MNANKAFIVAATASLVVAAGIALATDSGSAQPVKDSVITTKVKAELTKDRDTKARDIHVKTENGTVTLTGSVDSDAEKQKAEQNARAVKGVVNVSNDLSVKTQ